MKFTQHVPSYVDGLKPIVVEVTSKEELEAVPFVKEWLQDINFRFFRVNSCFLLAVLKDAHYVVGHADDRISYYPDVVWRAE